MNTYMVFKRAWWKYDANKNLVPNPGARKTVLRRGLTENEARAFCREFNLTNSPGRLSVKAEYTKE